MAAQTFMPMIPEGMEEASKLLDNVTYCENAYSVAEGADALVIVTEWDAFRALDFGYLKDSMKSHNLIDLRNIYRKDFVEDAGFQYISIGRP